MNAPGSSADPGRRPALTHANDDPGPAHGRSCWHDGTPVLTEVLRVPLCATSRSEAALKPRHQVVKQRTGRAAVAVPGPPQPLAVIELARQGHPVCFALRHAGILADQEADLANPATLGRRH
jgi:hypothetical protein